MHAHLKINSEYYQVNFYLYNKNLNIQRVVQFIDFIIKLMFKKTNNHQIKGGNIAKIKYFLPSSSSHRQQNTYKQQNPLNKIKKSINQKYNRSYSNSKTTSKRHSTAKHQTAKQNCNQQQITANEDMSFQIVGIRDVSSKQNSPTKINFFQQQQRKYQYPLEQKNYNTNYNKINPSLNDKNELKMTFGSSNKNYQQKQQKYSILQDSRKIVNMSKNTNEFQKIMKQFPKKQQRKQFQQFLQKLKDDQNYQNTISMFTIMYFYESKAKNK